MKTLRILAACMAVAALASCKQDNFTPEMKVMLSGKPVEAGVPASATIDYRGGNLTARVETNTEWVATCDQNWVSLDPASGASGTSPIKITAEANPEFSLRKATVTIALSSYPSELRTIVISQGADSPFINVNKESLEFEKDASTNTFSLSANVAWTVSGNPEWVSVTPATGNPGMVTVTVGVAANTEAVERNCILTFTAGEAVAYVAVLQRANLSGYYVDADGVNHGLGINIGGKLWAPVNCGYRPATEGDAGHPYGRYYQWGRPVGFGYNNSDEGIVEADIAENVNGPVQNVEDALPGVFYKNSANWLASVNTTLWNSGTEENPVKTQYDPCPEGWRVPTLTEMELLIATKEKTTIDGLLHWAMYGDGDAVVNLAAAGNIATGSNSADRGVAGYYWTSTYVDGTVILIYAGNWCAKNDWTNQPARGCTVRCVAE